MGQAADRSRQQLQAIGYFPLPSSYSLDEFGLFSAAGAPSLKGFTVLLNPEDIAPYMRHLQFRRKHQSLLVQVAHVEVKQHLENYCKLTVYVEHLALRLDETVSLHFQAMVRILYKALSAFSVLFQQFGYFTVDSSLIGVTPLGEAKCWANRKFSHSSPKASYSYSKNAKGEGSMVQELKEIFQCHADRFTVPRDFTLVGSSFAELTAELECRFGKEQLEARIDPAQRPVVVPQVGKQEVAPKVGSGVTVRFNYQMKQPSSGVRITFNSQGPPRTASSSLGKPKINFNYQAGDKSLQATKANSLIRQP